MNAKPKAPLMGAGIGNLPGGNISIVEATTIPGVSLDGAGDPAEVYSMRGGRMLTIDRTGNFVPKRMADCIGANVLQELCGHLRFDLETGESANCIPCRMPYIASMFMPRLRSDRPLPAPPGSKNLAFIKRRKWPSTSPVHDATRKITSSVMRRFHQGVLMMLYCSLTGDDS